MQCNTNCLAKPKGIKYKSVHLCKLLNRQINSQQKLKSCLSLQLGISCVTPKSKSNTTEEIQHTVQFNNISQCCVWNQLLSESSEFDIDSTNMSEVIAKFNSLNDYISISNMIKQNIYGLKLKFDRLDNLLSLTYSYENSLHNMTNRLLLQKGTINLQ
ncbi:Hypothetical_protein [Hexamita inflata]|uniref:Hypothetical_protein n=1 Tax=Hexamita inflata TaxID=28002 RepID=A0AA86UG08_9EUKA|nr:Hypothetical protein HINF_LOCUS26793 [Hexamita inflata]